MEKAELIQTLEKLHAHLAEATNVDADAEAKLRTVTDDIHRLLDENDASNLNSQSLAGSLSELLLTWEADHPHVAQLIGRAANALSNLGI